MTKLSNQNAILQLLLDVLAYFPVNSCFQKSLEKIQFGNDCLLLICNGFSVEECK